VYVPPSIDYPWYLQYLTVYVPPSIDYPWRWNTPVIINSALIKWIYLPDFYTIPNSKNLIGQSLSSPDLSDIVTY
jgi:hypothetical protein